MKKLSLIIQSILIVALNSIISNKSGFGADVYPPVKSKGDLIFYLDASSFRATEQRTIHEFYYDIPLGQLSFQKTEKGFTDSLKLTLILTDSSNNKLLHKQWVDPIFVDSLQKVEGTFLPQQIELTLYPGLYFVSLTINELNSGSSGSTFIEINTPSYSGESLTLSEIQFASFIRPDSSQDQFVKNGIKVVPNPNRLFGKTLPILYFYVEIYNLQPTAIKEKNSYKVEYLLYDLNRKIVQEYPAKIKHKPGTSSFEVGGINIAFFNQPSLVLAISVTDNLTGQMATAERKFWITSEVIAVKSEAEKKIMGMSEQEIDNHFAKIKYILPQQAISDFQKLNYDARRRFLIDFWTFNDPNPITPDNEFWDSYFKNVEYVNQHFSSSLVEGWKTDRGRITLKYGQPDEVQYYPWTSNSKPYEIWYYYQPEQMKFIFVDEEGFGRFRLIYSSDEKEATDPNWQTIITPPNWSDGENK